MERKLSWPHNRYGRGDKEEKLSPAWNQTSIIRADYPRIQPEI
jgi:hypothetical protein